MAIVQYSGLVTQIRGKLAGSVFNKSRTAFTVQRKQQPRRSASGYQQQHRNKFSRIQRSWSGEPPESKLLFEEVAANNPVRDRFGNLVHISGYNYYIRMQLLRAGVGEQITNAPDTITAPPLGLELLILDFRAEPFINAPVHIKVQLQFETLIASDRTYGVIMYYSSQVSPGITNFYGRYFTTEGKEVFDFPVVSGITSLTWDFDAVSSYPPPDIGKEVSVKLIVFDLQIGAIVQQFVIRSLVQTM